MWIEQLKKLSSDTGTDRSLWSLPELSARVSAQIQMPSGQEEAQAQVCACDKYWQPGDLGSA